MTRTRPTARGVGLLIVGVVMYLAARLLGTWELYLLSFAFVAALFVSWLLVVVTGRKLTVTRTLTPERPVAGDSLLLSFRARNGSVLPGLQVSLRGADGGLGEPDRAVDLEGLRSHGVQEAAAGPWLARRGVHRLPPLLAEAEDPLGLVRMRRQFADLLEFTVYPNLTHLRSCAFLVGAGERRETGRGGLAALGGFEFRGIRPHNPGEPLSHVDWKSTAKTGELMLRETEDPADSDVTVLLEGAASCLVGQPPESNFELAVEATGSLVNFALRAGRGVNLLLAERDWTQIRLSADADGRNRLLETLARAEPHGSLRLGPSLRVLLASGGSLLRRQGLKTHSLVLVVLSLDRELARVLMALREEGREVSVVHIAGESFASTTTAVPPAAVAPTPETRSLRLSLASAGVACLTVNRGDDLGSVLSLPRAVRTYARLG
jgi:uncharacterized protein (DUF58 family)